MNDLGTGGTATRATARLPAIARAQALAVTMALPVAAALGLAWPLQLRAAEPDDERRLDVLEVYVEGNTVLPVQAIEDALAPFLGPARPLSDIDRARAALEAAYAERGWRTVRVEIPRQRGEGGLVRLAVVEQPVGRVEVQGARYHSPQALLDELPALAPGQVPNIDALQRQLLASSANADRRVVPAISAGRAPDTVDVALAVDDELPLHGSVELNNRNSAATPPLRATATLRYDNLWQARHAALFSLQASPERWVGTNVLYASYTAPLSPTLSLSASLLNSHSKVATINGQNSIGEGRTWGLRATVELPADEPWAHNLTLGVERKHQSNRAEGTPTEGDALDNATPYDYTPLQLGYALEWRTDQASIDGNVGLRLAHGSFGTQRSTLDESRFRTRTQQAAIAGELNGLWKPSAALELSLKLGGQWTDQPLLSGEQYSIGGQDSVRGYYESEALGDLGLYGAFELRGPSLTAWREVADPPIAFDQFRPFLFVDAGRVQIVEPLPEERSVTTLASVGTGLRFSMGPSFEGSFHWAHVLRAGPSSGRGRERLLFRLLGAF